MTAGDWWGVNALQCWLGALAEVLIQMTIADVFFIHQRGLMNSIYIWVSNVGGQLAVVASGFITQNMGWRWVWWFCAILFGLQVIMFVFGFEETKFMHVETLAGRQGSVVSTADRGHTAMDKLEKEKQGLETPPDHEAPVSDYNTTEVVEAEAMRKLSTININTSIPRKTYWQKLNLLTTTHGPWSHFLRHSYQPFMILATIPGVLFCSLVYAIVLAWSTVQTTAISTYMLDPPYNFSASQIGLMSLAAFIGSTLGSVIVGPLSDWTVLRLARRNNGIYEPEMRFWCFLPFIPFQLAGAWWFAYALADGAHWSQVAVAYGMCNFGAAPLQSLALTYLLDAYNGKTRGHSTCC
jgi:MFS family permease